MYEKNGYKTLPWNPNDGEDIDMTKKAMLAIIRSQKVSLSKVRYLFDCIVEEIEDNNPVNL